MELCLLFDWSEMKNFASSILGRLKRHTSSKSISVSPNAQNELLLTTHSHYILLIGLNVTSYEWNHYIFFYKLPQTKLGLFYEWIVVKKFVSQMEVRKLDLNQINVHISFTRQDTWFYF